MSQETRSVLVTGAGGFIGRHTIEPLLRRGFVVHTVSSRRDGERGEGVVSHVCDLLDPVATRELMARVAPTHLLHLAWYTAPDQFWSALENLTWLQASLTLATSFRAHGGRRLVTAGSCAEYDWSRGFLSEADTPTVPATLYGATKHALQVSLSHYARQAGLSYACGRVFFMFGPHEKATRLVPATIRALLNRQEARCSSGTQLRDYAHVRDVAGAFVALLDSDFAGPVNIASGRPVSVKEIVLRIADRLDGRALVRLGELTPRADEPPLLLADVRTLRERLGFKDAYDLESGLDDTIRWWRDRAGPTRS
jgi:nucleoside-diphosphate-sugar epimerase